MNRLTRDFAALRRSFQISGVKVNVLVEGREVDGYLYDKLCKAVITPTGRTYRIIRGDEIAGGGSGGKLVLLSFYDYLKRRSALQLSGKYTTLFCLDKDVDDLEHRLRRSEHVHYTRSYDIENLLVENADLSESAAASMSLPVSLFTHLSPAAAWCDAAQVKWTAWTALCLTSRSLHVNQANYAAPSRVNVPFHNGPDPAKVSELIARIGVATATPASYVRDQYVAHRKKVEQRIRVGRGSQLFKGKWYLLILSSELEAMGGTGRSVGALRYSLQTALLQQADPMAPCFSSIRAALVQRTMAV